MNTSENDRKVILATAAAIKATTAAIKATTRVAFECMECGKKFVKPPKERCPKCGGVDIDLPRVS